MYSKSLPKNKPHQINIMHALIQSKRGFQSNPIISAGFKSFVYFVVPKKFNRFVVWLSFVLI